jgi:hypothetical protein
MAIHRWLAPPVNSASQSKPEVLLQGMNVPKPESFTVYR